MHTDEQTDGRTDMMKLIVAFRNFENAPKNMKKNVNLSYNITILSSTTFLQKRPLPPPPHAGFIGTNTPHILFLEEEKTEGDNKSNSSFSVYSSCKERPNNEN